MSKKKIYLASPFFNDKEKEVLNRAIKILRGKGLDVFVPMEHQHTHLEFGSMEWREATFKSDVDAIDESDIVVALLDGNYTDSGTCWEIGYAFCNKKPVIVFSENGKEINLMIAQTLHAVLNTYEELENYDFNELKPIPYLEYVW